MLQIRRSLKRDIRATTTELCAQLGLQHRLQFAVATERLAWAFLSWLLQKRLQSKQERVDTMKKDLMEKRHKCTVCGQMPPAGQYWKRKSEKNQDGLLCGECDDEEVQYPRMSAEDFHTRKTRIAKYEDRLPAISLAKASIVAACFFIEAEQLLHRFRVTEVCSALGQLGFKKQKETLKKWIGKVRLVQRIPAMQLVDRISGFACRLLESYTPSDPRVGEQEARDVGLMARGILRADAKVRELGHPTNDNNKKCTVQNVDGLLQRCLLDSRLREPELIPTQQKKKPLGGRSERIVAAVIVYLRLRLRSGDHDNVTILEHRSLTGIDMQSFQAVKRLISRLIDPVLWA